MEQSLKRKQPEHGSTRTQFNDLEPPTYEMALAFQSSTMPDHYSDQYLQPTRSDMNDAQSRSLSSPNSSSFLERPTTVTSGNHLRKVIAIPATMPSIGSPFLRAYPTSLENYNISRELFLKFLDDLNRISVKNPPLQILSLSAGIVGFVPLATAQIVSGAVQLAANIGTVGLSKGRTELFLRDANRTIFSPRGLKCEIAKIDAVAKVAGIPILNNLDKVEKNLSILDPINDITAGETVSVTSQQRRLQALEPYIAHLDFEPLPSIDVPSNPLSKLSAAASERERTKGEKKMTKSRKEAHEKYFEEKEKLDRDLSKDITKLEQKEAKALSKGAKPDKLRKIEKDRREIIEEYEEEMEKITKDRRKDDKEESGMRKILWVLIRNLEDSDQMMRDETEE